MSHEAFRMLRETLPRDAVYWINATDPVSLCGSSLGSLQSLPPRIASTHLVYHGSRLVMISKRLGKSIDLFVGPDDAHLPDYFALFKDLLTREFNPIQKIIVESVNNGPVLRSSYVETLKQFGFRSARQGMELWKEY
jgi:ATP-dependent Lhr-like helicase